jgi:hypothetical protein
MKRWIFTILLFVLLGAIVTVAVAWYEASSFRGCVAPSNWGWPCDTLYRGPSVTYHTDVLDMPYQPIWPGFLVNALFYGIILWLLIPGPFVLRRHIRRSRRVEGGRCPKCGYDLRGAPPGAGCPECGWMRASEHTTGGDGA